MKKIASYEDALDAANLVDVTADEVKYALIDIAENDKELWNSICERIKQEDVISFPASNLFRLVNVAQSHLDFEASLALERGNETPTIDRMCAGTFMFAIDNIENEQEAEALVKQLSQKAKEMNANCFVEAEILDSDRRDKSAIYSIEYGYVEDVPIILGFAGTYFDPPVPDEYDMTDPDRKAWDMGKELQKVFEDLGYTVGDWAIDENRVESEEMLDDKRHIKGWVNEIKYLEAGKTTTASNCGKCGVTINITKYADFVPEDEANEEMYNLADIKVLKHGHIIGRAEDIPFKDVENALFEIYKGEARVNDKEILFYPAMDGVSLEDAVEAIEEKRKANLGRD